MDNFVIAVGTDSSQKIGYINEVLEEIGLKAKIISSKVSSGVSDQPVSENDTLKGSINRAREALLKTKQADIGLGLEVGYNLNLNKDYEIFCYCTIMDKNDLLISACSSRYLLPEFHQQKLKNNLYLGDYVREYFKKSEHPAVQFVAEMVRGRKPFIIEACRNALLSYLNKD